MTYISTKTYGHDIGLSVCFRQWKADSHCHFLHGYALAVRVEFAALELDEHHWVVDFGGLKDFKQQLVDLFDHKLLVASDDPERGRIMHLKVYNIADVLEVPATGCEAFARLVHGIATEWLKNHDYTPRVRVYSVEVREHGANSAIYIA